jgi:hypothetical protein
VIRVLRRNLGLGVAAMTISVVTSQSASALAYNDILGKWCGVSSNLNWTNMLFARDVLTITHLPQKATTVFKIDHYEFTDTIVTVYYRSISPAPAPVPGRKIFKAVYLNFSSDRKTMSQPAGVNQNAYRFTRCP